MARVFLFLQGLWQQVERSLSALYSMSSSNEAVARSFLRGAAQAGRAKHPRGKKKPTLKKSPKGPRTAEAVAEPCDDRAVEEAPAVALPAKKRPRGDPEKISPWHDAVKQAQAEWEARGLGKGGLPK